MRRQMLIGSRIWIVLAMLMVERPGGLFEGRQIWFVNLSTCRIPEILTSGIQNEYSKQIKEYRAQEKPGKAHGKVFVKGKLVSKSVIAKSS